MIWIDTPAGLTPLAAALATAPWIALDSEANSMFVYRERMCLLQLNVAGELYVVDVLALLDHAGWTGIDAEGRIAAPSTALDALKPGLARSDRICWLHGGEYDCGLLTRDFALALGGVWDTQQAASLLGWEATGYGAVVERTLGIHLAKAHAQEDWGRRPVSDAAMEYALDDVRHLPAAGERLKQAIAEADLVEEHAIASAAVAASTSHGGGFDPAGFWRIKGVHKEVPKANLGILTDLYRWRDGIARAANQPPGRVINNEVLLLVARHAPTSYQQLKHIGVHGRVLNAHGNDLIERIRGAKEQPPAVPEPPRQREVDEAEEQREDRLKNWRRGEAAKRNVPLQVVLPAKSLDHLKRYGASDLEAVPQLGAKRIARYGAVIRGLCG